MTEQLATIDVQQKQCSHVRNGTNGAVSVVRHIGVLDTTPHGSSDELHTETRLCLTCTAEVIATLLQCERPNAGD